MKIYLHYKLAAVFLLIINFNYFCSISTTGQSTLGKFNLLLSSEKKVLKNLSINTIKSHTANLFSTYGYVDTLSFLVYITDQDDQFKSLTSKNIPEWAVGVAKGNKIVIKSPTQKSRTYDSFNKTLKHEITHIYLSQINNRFPSWFNEGFAMHTADQFDIRRKINISWNLLFKTIINLNQLKNFLSASKSQAYLYYSQSAASIDAMIFYYGDDILDSILFYAKQNKNFNQAFLKATEGDTIDDFSVKYISYLNNYFKFLFIYQFQKIVFFLIPFLLLLVWFYKKRRIKKMMKLWEIEDQLEDLKERENEKI
tara:strand:- start:213 stop:1145 length:933 start_codon:yes stop_codon:yes gene_type:complete